MATTGKGALRRAVLLAAACELLQEVGFDQTSHRAVATRAGLPLAATTYYFATLDVLLAAATQELRGQHLRAGRGIVDAMGAGPCPPDRLAEAVIGILVGDRVDPPPARVSALYERFLQAGRRPAVRPVVRDWNTGLADLLADLLHRVGRTPPPDGARTLLALADGILLSELAEGGDTALDQARRRLAVALPAVTGTPMRRPG
ncbi:TetR/AcrR family transcriptional regulator [Micromonospora sp. NBC_01813]|uniref:TetR/AcrR family transcriptional regulator n=1 Tax=Micromonospora sp. NBC_01813 TaxID=2975988 RepID=UPI002DDC335A|nr:TetR family transcriptional regulator [Micromonospora sp. NBC_01813]WSA11668.1 TetR family transcriptional regulator [Micromonospora sp. NBC_01813]